MNVELINNSLKALGWVKSETGAYSKMFSSVDLAGQLSDGSRAVIVALDNDERYLEAILGWDMILDADSRELNSFEKVKDFEDKLINKIYAR